MRTHLLNCHPRLRGYARAFVVRTALADHLARGGASESPSVFRRMKSE